MRKAREIHLHSDHNQTSWHLTCIMGASLGLPGTLVGCQLAKKYGLGEAISSIVIGNLLLWIISLAMISMALRKNAIQNVENFLGRKGAFLAAIFLIISFLDWFVLQIDATIEAFDPIISSNMKADFKIRLGAAFGFFIALLAMGGMKIIKPLATIIFPLAAIFLIYSLFVTDFSTSTFVASKSFWELSLAGTIAIVGQNLTGIINIPTFFRHARSKADAFLGLTFMTIVVSLMQIFTIYIGTCESKAFLLISSRFFYPLLAIVYIVVVLITTNLVNIYYASAGVEMLFPRGYMMKEYVIIGLLGTAVFSLLQISTAMDFLEKMANNFLMNLGFVLLMAFITKIIVKHRPRFFEKITNCLCWFVGCAVSLYLQIYSTKSDSSIFLLGISATILSFVIIVFLEETIWSIKKIQLKK